MEIKEQLHDDVVVLKLSGEMMGGPDATALNDKLHELIESGNLKVVVDLSLVSWVNSSGLGILIGALTTIRNAGGELVIASVTDRIQRLLQITKLDKVFDIYDVVESAVAAF
ncbi:MAG: STAS domain-containing protein [candidate division KSB1 bacterium]|nr:STAS domain-containing protein [candidate division KSB1 bacterium]